MEFKKINWVVVGIVVVVVLVSTAILYQENVDIKDCVKAEQKLLLENGIPLSEIGKGKVEVQLKSNIPKDAIINFINKFDLIESRLSYYYTLNISTLDPNQKLLFIDYLNSSKSIGKLYIWFPPLPTVLGDTPDVHFSTTVAGYEEAEELLQKNPFFYIDLTKREPRWNSNPYILVKVPEGSELVEACKFKGLSEVESAYPYHRATDTITDYKV